MTSYVTSNPDEVCEFIQTLFGGEYIVYRYQ